MEFKKIKKGDYVSWSAERMFKGWNTFGKIVSKNTKEIVILTYDDFTETILSKGGDAIKKEMQLADKEDVENYLIDVARELEIERINIKSELKRIDKEILKYKEFEV